MTINFPTDLGIVLARNKAASNALETLNDMSDRLSTGRISYEESIRKNKADELVKLGQMLEENSAYNRVTQRVSIAYSAKAAALSTIRDTVSELSSNTATFIAPEVQVNLSNLEQQTLDALADVKSTLELRIANSYQFSGAAKNAKPLPEIVDMLSSIESQLSSLPSLNAISVSEEIERFFREPMYFETLVYRGSDLFASDINISQSEKVTQDISAISPEIKDALAAIVTVYFGAKENSPMAQDEQSGLLRVGLDKLQSADKPLIDLEAKLGRRQKSLEENTVSLQASSNEIEARMESVQGIDLYSTAISLQATENRLTAIYSIIARQSQLSLVNFL